MKISKVKRTSIFAGTDFCVFLSFIMNLLDKKKIFFKVLIYVNATQISDQKWKSVQKSNFQQKKKVRAVIK